MTEPRSESPFASIRELTAAERRIMGALAEMKLELLTAIRHDSEAHANTHQAMRDVGEIRHRRIDDFLGHEALIDAKRSGLMSVGVYALRTARVVGEFRWLIAAVLVALALATGGASLNVVVR